VEVRGRSLDLSRGYEAPFLVRPDRLPLGKDSWLRPHPLTRSPEPRRPGNLHCRTYHKAVRREEKGYG